MVLARNSVLVFLYITVGSCRPSPLEPVTIDPRIIELQYEAMELYLHFNDDSTMKAIELLDQAIQIDPDHYMSYWTKHRFQVEVGQTSEALESLQRLEQLRPDDPQVLAAGGIYHARYGDSSLAMDRFRQSNEMYVQQLRYLIFDEEAREYVLLNMAGNYIAIGEEQNGRRILRGLSDQTTNESFKKVLELVLSLSREQVLAGEWSSD